jgi:hypothetical protein
LRRCWCWSFQRSSCRDGILTLLAGTVYIVTSGLLSAVFQTPGNVVFSLLAAGVIAVLFEPGRRLLQRTVNRLMYGERDDPYLVLTRLAQRLEGSPRRQKRC